MAINAIGIDINTITVAILATRLELAGRQTTIEASTMTGNISRTPIDNTGAAIPASTEKKLPVTANTTPKKSINEINNNGFEIILI